VAALAAGGGLAAGPAAQAAPATAGGLAPTVAAQHTFTIPAGAAGAEVTAGAARANVVRTPQVAAGQAIDCTLTVHNPFRYYGGPYGGGVEGLASVSCTNVVQRIDVTVGLYKNGSLVSYRTRTTYSSLQGGADTEYPYSSGNYQTGAVANIVFPAGYSPPSGSIPQVNSPVVYIP
jgi:hypothetical protein